MRTKMKKINQIHHFDPVSCSSLPEDPDPDDGMISPVDDELEDDVSSDELEDDFSSDELEDDYSSDELEDDYSSDELEDDDDSSDELEDDEDCSDELEDGMTGKGSFLLVKNLPNSLDLLPVKDLTTKESLIGDTEFLSLMVNTYPGLKL